MHRREQRRPPSRQHFSKRLPILLLIVFAVLARSTAFAPLPAQHVQTHATNDTGDAAGAPPFRLRRRHPSRFLSSFFAANYEGGSSRVGDIERRRRDDRIASALLFLAVPAASASLPALLSIKLYGPLLVAKRACVYGMAGTIVAVAAIRGADDDPALGRRLEGLTAEVLPRPTPPSKNEEEEDAEDDDRFRELRNLDSVGSTAQSAALPAIVAGSLALSVFLLELQEGGGDVALEDLGGLDSLVSTFRDSVREAAPALVGLSNAVVLGLFSRAEVNRAIRAWWLPLADADVNDSVVKSESVSEPPSLITPLALALVAAAYLLPPSLAWPARNAASMSLGIAVSRAAQLPRFGPIALALSALLLYDVVSVGVMLVDLGSATVAMSADGAAGAGAEVAASAASSSAMGAVALSKVGGAVALSGGDSTLSLWQPGLLEVRLRGRATDLLGLGDAVFPSLLATFALRFDRRQGEGEEQRKHKGLSGESVELAPKLPAKLPLYFSASMVGFAAGCLTCEYVPGIDSSGLPALLFIVPSMFTAFLGLASVRGELGEIWKFDAAGNTDAVYES